tara:strand:- start:62 stop:448 length:387 start_codon:yes stop_codon:yes gene_type:complete
LKNLVSISDLSKQLGLINKKTNKPLNYILRYWEKEFKQIKPRIINKRRYYSDDQVRLIKLIEFLLKDKGVSIRGVKKLLKSDIKKLDGYNSDSLKVSYYKKTINEKSNKLLEKIKNLRKYGKKISHKS